MFAQNRWDPMGAAVRAAPMPTADTVAGFGSNELVPVDGWVRTRAPYEHNRPPWDSDVWFHVADGSGWVSYAAVRADATVPDPSLQSREGGRPVPLDESCSATLRP